MTEGEPTLGAVVTALNDLKEQNDKDHASLYEFVGSGFDRITKRQDIANNRISKLERYLYIAVGAVGIAAWAVEHFK